MNEEPLSADDRMAMGAKMDERFGPRLSIASEKDYEAGFADGTARQAARIEELEASLDRVGTLAERLGQAIGRVRRGVDALTAGREAFHG